MVLVIWIALAICASSSMADEIFVAITSQSCPPCRALHKDYEDDKRFVWLDATEEVRKRENVRGVPTIIAVRDGQEIGRTTGYNGKQQMDAWIKEMEAKDASTARSVQAATTGAAARR